VRALAATLALVVALLAGSFAAAAVVAPPAQAASSLSKKTADRYAKRAATNRAKQNKAISGWEIVRGFRFDSRKWVYVWYAQMADGTVCSAQLVTRYASTKSSKVVAYFRIEQCS
jgi:hypothetical protein